VARTFCLLITLFTALLGSEQFWFSYKIVTINGISIFEEKNIVPAMTFVSEGEKRFCTIELNPDKTLSLEQFLKKHFDTILPCFYALSTHVLANHDGNPNLYKDRIELVIAPVRFTVVFKDEFATINTFR